MARNQPSKIKARLGLSAAAAVGMTLFSGPVARADVPYFKGFETSRFAYGWWFEPPLTTGVTSLTTNAGYGSGTYSITQFKSDSAGSPLGPINAASGGYYAVIGDNMNGVGAGLQPSAPGSWL